MNKTIRATYHNDDQTIYVRFVAEECRDGSIDDLSVDIEFAEICGERLNLAIQSPQLMDILLDLRHQLDINDWEHV